MRREGPRGRRELERFTKRLERVGEMDWGDA